jgi:hypothetical protein
LFGAASRRNVGVVFLSEQRLRPDPPHVKVWNRRVLHCHPAVLAKWSSSAMAFLVVLFHLHDADHRGAFQTLFFRKASAKSLPLPK